MENGVLMSDDNFIIMIVTILIVLLGLVIFLGIDNNNMSQMKNALGDTICEQQQLEYTKFIYDVYTKTPEIMCYDKTKEEYITFKLLIDNDVTVGLR